MFRADRLVAWEQYEVGSGKQFLFSELRLDLNQQLPQLTPISESTVIVKDVKIRKSKSTVSEQAEQDVSDQVETEKDTEIEVQPSLESSSNVFTCPEDGCISSFLKHGNLAQHLDTGKHVFAHDNKTVKDRVVLSYASLAENKSVMGLVLKNDHSALKSIILKRGWAFKIKKETKRFSKETVDFLTAKFSTGEITGIKCDPEEVSKDMRRMRGGDGRRLFSRQDFLSSNQISSFLVG